MQQPIPNSRQLDALRLYGHLIEVRENWSGSLVVCCGSGCVANPTSVAVSVAGGATLAIDADAGALKSAMRNGELDFVVNSLDEALRTLKNEVRQHRPLGVGLVSDMTVALAEIVDRGVQPDLLLVGPDQSAQPIVQNASIGELVAAGMPLGLPGSDPDAVESQYRPTTNLPRGNCSEVHLTAPDAATLKEIDERLLAILSAEDVVRRRWIQRASKYLRDARVGGRWIWLSDEERKQLSA
jgi:urocanate hydratase